MREAVFAGALLATNAIDANAQNTQRVKVESIESAAQAQLKGAFTSALEKPAVLLSISQKGLPQNL